MNKINIQNITDAISKALSNSPNEIRSRAQADLIIMRNQHTSDFFLLCSQILADQNQKQFLRQSAGTVAGRLLIDRNQNTNNYFWDDIPQNIKENIKNNILNVLICHNLNIMRSAASVIAFIASIQLPRGEMQDFIDVLAQNCQNENLSFKNASVTALGYVCEQIKNSHKKISQHSSQQILGGIILTIRENTQDQIVCTSFKALQNCLSFLTELMKESKYRDTVFNLLTNQFQKNKYLQQTYNALYQFVKASSANLTNYKQSLISLSQAHLQYNEDIRMKNLILWDTIGTQYSQKMRQNRERIGVNNNQQNFMQLVSNQMLPNIMKCLLIIKEDKDEAKQLINATTKAISAFTQTCDRNVIDLITNGVQTLLGIQDPNQQQATILLFSTICDYQDYDYIFNLCTNGFDHLFKLLESNSQLVVKNSLYGFVRIAEVFPQVFLSHKNIKNIMETFINYLKVDVQQYPEVVDSASLILINISQGLQKQQFRDPVCSQPQILLTSCVSFYTQNWYFLHLNNQREINLRIATVILNIIIRCQKRDVVLQLIQFMIDQYYKIIKFPNLPDSGIVIEQVFSILHTGILVLKTAVINLKLLQKIIEVINYQKSRVRKFQQQSLNLFGACVTSFGKATLNYAKGFWPDILSIFKDYRDAAVIKAGLSCIGDIARSLESDFQKQSFEAMNLILKQITNQLIERDLKIWMLSCIGDLVMALKNQGQVFIQRILQICNICFTAVYQLGHGQNQIDYVQSLKTTIIQMYACFIFSIIQNKKVGRYIYDHFGCLATFVIRTCDHNLHPTVDYLKSCLYLIFDTSSFLWNVPNVQHNKIRQILHSNEIKNLLSIMKKFENRNDIRELFDFIYVRMNL